MHTEKEDEMHTQFWLENFKGWDHVGNAWHRPEDSIKTNITEIGCEGVDWIQLVQDRVQQETSVNTVVHLDSKYQLFKVMHLTWSKLASTLQTAIKVAKESNFNY
jgi:hypothetical protein